MSITGQTIFSAVNAILEFDGQEVGTAQSLRIEEDYQVKPIPVLGSNFPFRHIPGTFTGKITAERVFLERDSLLSVLYPGVIVSEALVRLLADPSRTEASVRIQADRANQLMEAYNRIFVSPSRNTAWNFVVKFDVAIKKPDGERVYEAQDCVITTRSLNVAINEVLAMERVQMVFNRRTR